MKIKKLKKLSIFAMIFAFTATIPVMADYTPTNNAVSQSLSLNVRSFASIQKAEGSTTNAVVSITSPTSVTMTTPIAVSYNVNSNAPATLTVSATAPVSDGTGTVNALYGTATNAMTLVFTKSDSTTASSAVTDASSSSPTAASNVDAVAFTFTPDTPTATVGTAPTISVEDNSLLYSVGTGRFNLPFKVEGTSVPGTYSVADTLGEYKATLIVSQVDT